MLEGLLQGPRARGFPKNLLPPWAARLAPRGLPKLLSPPRGAQWGAGGSALPGGGGEGMKGDVTPGAAAALAPALAVGRAAPQPSLHGSRSARPEPEDPGGSCRISVPGARHVLER